MTRSTTLPPLAALAGSLVATTALAAALPTGFAVAELQADPDGTPPVTEPRAFTPDGGVYGTTGANQWHSFIATPDGTFIDLHPWPQTWLSEVHDVGGGGHVAMSVSVPPAGDGAYTDRVVRRMPDGTMQDLTALGGPFVAGQHVSDLDVDDTGRLALQMWSSTDGHVTWCYDDDAGGWIELGAMLDGAQSTRLAGMTSDGTTFVTMEDGVASHLLRRDADGGVTTVHARRGWGAVHVDAIGDDGTAVGQDKDDDGVWGAFAIRPDGTYERLHDALPGAIQSRATHVSPGGVVAGTFYTEPFEQHVFIADEDDVRVLALPEAVIGAILGGVNDDGVIAGTLHDETYAAVAFVSDGTEVVRVQDVVDPDAGTWIMHVAVDVDASGRVLLGAQPVSDPSPWARVALVLKPLVEGACPADLSGDAEVGLDDLLIVLASYGADDGGDVDGDADTDFDDLVAVLDAWGAGCG